jgi:8-oxo-dGTP pyrophosphatase MutT (NUDIX family)
MPTPEFIKAIRQKVGHELLLLPGVSGLVFDADGRILLQKRSDTGRWAVLGGIPEPGEEPADAIVREISEETALDIAVERLVGVYTNPIITYPNGDRVQFTITAFRCRIIGGQLRINDDESLDLRFFALNELPELRADHRLRIEHAAANRSEAYFAPPRCKAIGS